MQENAQASAEPTRMHDIIQMLVPRSSNTIHTLVERASNIYRRDASAVVAPSLNVQRHASTGSMTGVFTNMDASTQLSGLEFGTEDLFGGISITRCHMTESDIIRLLTDTERVRGTLCGIAGAEHRMPALSEILPRENARDFVWFACRCQSKATDNVVTEVKRDIERNTLNFYDMWEISHNANGMLELGYDTAVRDSCPWHAQVRNGMLGLFQQKTGPEAGLYLACMSSVPSLGSEIMKAVKSDIQQHCTIGDFATSKEVYFLENLSRRNRQRLLYAAAQALGIKVSTQVDFMAHTSQRDSLLAVETCGVQLESLYQLESALAGATHRVVHARGCVDLSKNSGPIPFYVGHGLPMLVFSPDPVLRCTNTIQNDGSRFMHVGVCDYMIPFPVVNIEEDALQNVTTVQKEVDMLSKVQAAHLQQTAEQYAMAPVTAQNNVLNMKNNFNENMFYGVYYGPSMPIVLYPKTPARFALSDKSFAAPKPNPVATHRTQSATQRKTSKYKCGKNTCEFLMHDLFRRRDSTYSTDTPFFSFEECTETDLGTSVTHVLDWDANIVSIVCRAMSDGCHSMHVTELLPVAVAVA